MHVLRVTGSISAKKITRDHEEDRLQVLLMGFSGAGKSSFIEALSGDPDLKISSNRLESFTQSIAAYKLENVNLVDDNRIPWGIWLIDTPGFLDAKTSELDIIVKAAQWIRSHRKWTTNLLYFIPITDLRLSRTRQRTMETFKAITGLDTAQKITIVTTMWDTLHRDEAKSRAQTRFEELKGGPWCDLISKGAQMTKFFNTPGSALDVLKLTLEGKKQERHFELERHFHRIDKETSFRPQLLSDLQSRVEYLQSAEAGILGEMAQVLPNDGVELIVVLREQLKGVQRDRQRFSQQLRELEKPDFQFDKEQDTEFVEGLEMHNNDVEDMDIVDGLR